LHRSSGWRATLGEGSSRRRCGMSRFVSVGNRSINLEMVTEIRWDDQDRDGRPRVKVYFPGGGDDERDYTTLSLVEGAELREAIEEVGR
jgi:hypothetical protein